jgi:hypothetical protein
MLKGSTVKEVNVLFRGQMLTVIAWSMFSQRKTECYPTVIPFHGISTYDLVCWGKQTELSYGNTIPRNLVVWYVEETFRIDELRCCSDVEVLVCKAVKNVQVLEAEKRRTNDERTNDWSELSRFDWYEFRSTGTNSDRLVRMIGPNSERLVRIPNEFRTNDEFDVGVFKKQKKL